MQDRTSRDGTKVRGYEAADDFDPPLISVQTLPHPAAVTDPVPDPLAGLRARPDPRDPRAPTLLRPWTEGEPLAGQTVVLGFPYDGGIPSRPGARFGPRAIR